MFPVLLRCCLRNVHYSCMQKAIMHGIKCLGCGNPLSLEKPMNCRSAGKRFTPLDHVHTLHNICMSFIVIYFKVTRVSFLTLSIPFCVHCLQDFRKLQYHLHQSCVESLGQTCHLHQDHLLSTGHSSHPYLKRYGTIASGSSRSSPHGQNRMSPL